MSEDTNRNGSRCEAQVLAGDLEAKIVKTFGEMAIDKRRLPMSQLQKRGIPAYVAEWVLETVIPGSGPITPEEADKVKDWAARNIPGPGDQNSIKSRLLRGETVRVRRIERGGLRSAAEVEAELNAIPPGTGLLEVFPSIDGNTLYEMALALDRIRLRDDHPSYVLAATDLMTTPAAHPLWDDQMMAQPLGVLDIFVIDA